MHTDLASAPGTADEALARTALTRVAIAGATGYTGQELVRILSHHPAVTLSAAMSSGATATRKLPALARLWTGEIMPLSPETLKEADTVFLALPDKAAAELGPMLVDAGVRVVDLSGAFRLRSADERERWYPETHRVPAGTVYGLTELERTAVADARLIANPGCYPTATLLALSPIAAAGLLAPGSDVIVDAKSGVSGAGKTPSERTHFCECHGSLGAYGVFGHRHGAEIQQGLALASRTPAAKDSETAAAAGTHLVNFVPHLIPIDRGILATIYLRLTPGTTEDTLADVFQRTYQSAPFVRLVGSTLPEIKHVAHTNFCDIGWRVDASGRAVLVSVIDNLVKGASGQAVQNLNVMLGIDERTGLW
jgi:N-acetyl-gamma-glutamyl-phosphate reductase